MEMILYPVTPPSAHYHERHAGEAVHHGDLDEDNEGGAQGAHGGANHLEAGESQRPRGGGVAQDAEQKYATNS